ncbi:MAG: epoxyqueuosine reductase QueH [Spirochaetia bacterium]
MKKSVLLHACCGPCATASLERLLSQGWKVGVLFANSNIAPVSEFEKRYENLARVTEFYKVRHWKQAYSHGEWLKEIGGFEKAPEGGERCARCFAYSLRLTAEKAEALGFDAFSTSLTVSPHKDSKRIFSIGNEHSCFLAENFKKRDGFKRSIELSKQLSLYRQDYCGCEFSKAHIRDL